MAQEQRMQQQTTATLPGVDIEASVRLKEYLRSLLNSFEVLMPGVGIALEKVNFIVLDGPQFGVQTAAVDKHGNIYINKRWFNELGGLSSQMAVILHELLHYLLLHPYIMEAYSDVLNTFAINAIEDAAVDYIAKQYGIGKRISYITVDELEKRLLELGVPEGVVTSVVNAVKERTVLDAIRVLASWCRKYCAQLAAGQAPFTPAAVQVCNCFGRQGSGRGGTRRGKCPMPVPRPTPEKGGEKQQGSCRGGGTGGEEQKPQGGGQKQVWSSNRGDVPQPDDVAAGKKIGDRFGKGDLNDYLRKIREIIEQYEARHAFKQMVRPYESLKSVGAGVPPLIERLERLYEEIINVFRRIESDFVIEQPGPRSKRSMYRPSKQTLALEAVGYRPAPVTPSRVYRREAVLFVPIVDVSGSIGRNELEKMVSLVLKGATHLHPSEIAYVFFSDGPVDYGVVRNATQFKTKVSEVGIKGVGGGTYMAPAILAARNLVKSWLRKRRGGGVVVAILSDFVISDDDVKQSIEELQKLIHEVESRGGHVKVYLFTTDAANMKAASTIKNALGTYAVLFEIPKLVLA